MIRNNLYIILSAIFGGLAGWFSVRAASIINDVSGDLSTIHYFIPLGFYLFGFIASSIVKYSERSK